MKTTLITLLLSVSYLSFAQSPESPFTVRVHEISDPDGLNPLTSKAANAENIEDNLFSRLLEFNRTNFELEPALAEQLPTVVNLKQGKYRNGVALTYTIRPEAIWDNGSPITGYDYLFTVKTIKHRGIECAERRLGIEFIDEVEVDESNPKTFTVYSKSTFFKAEAASGNSFHLIPEYVYDPKKVMRTVSIETLHGVAKNYPEPVQQFATTFSQDKYATTPPFVSGSGPYMLTEWSRGAKLVLERKKNWWGDQVKGDNPHLKAYPEKIEYIVISSMGWAMKALKNNEIDILRNVPYNRFLEAKEDAELKGALEFHNPSQFAYHYLGFNTDNPKLSDKRVRQAIAHVVDRQKIINEFFGGEAVLINTPISPNKIYYNLQVPAIEFDLNKAKELLEKAGWKDSDGDDVLDKKINGKSTKLRLKYNYNKGNMVRKAIGEMLRQNLATIGVKLDLYPLDFPSLLTNANDRNYEMLALAWVNSPGLDDLKHVWHSSSDKKGGGNRVGFNSSKVDKLIDEINITLDRDRRKELYLQVQELIAEEHPYVFLVVPNELIMIRKGLEYPPLSPVRPGYITRLFQQK